MKLKPETPNDISAESELLTKDETSKFLGVTPRTVNNYMERGVLTFYKNKVNGKILIDKTSILNLLGSKIRQDKEVVVYCRVSGLPDRGGVTKSSHVRLQAQVDRVVNYCTSAGIRVDRVIKEVGKAHSIKDRPGFDELLELVMRRKVSTIIVETPDRIARWAGEEIIERFLDWHGVKIHIINKTWTLEEYRQEAKDDLSAVLIDAKTMMATPGQAVNPSNSQPSPGPLKGRGKAKIGQ